MKDKKIIFATTLIFVSSLIVFLSIFLLFKDNFFKKNVKDQILDTELTTENKIENPDTLTNSLVGTTSIVSLGTTTIPEPLVSEVNDTLEIGGIKLFENNFYLGVLAGESVYLSVQLCDEDECWGSGYFIYSDLDSKEFKGVNISGDVAFYKNTMHLNSQKDIGRFTSSGPINIKDYNFDGFPDHAIRSGRNEYPETELSEYDAAPIYDIYLYDPEYKDFYLSDSLTEIASHNLGSLSFDEKDKTINILYGVDGPWYEYYEYKFINNEPVLVNKYSADASKLEAGYAILSQDSLINGVWINKITMRMNKEEFLNFLNNGF